MKKKTLLSIPALFLAFLMNGQQPTHVPSPQNNTPIDLSNWFDIIVYILLPLILIILYFMWRKQSKQDSENNGPDSKRN